MDYRIYELANGDCAEIDDSGYFCAPQQITVSLDDLINVACEGDYENVLDLISTRLTGCDLLTDIEYKVIGMVNGDIVLEVNGSVNMILEVYAEDNGDDTDS